METNILNTYIYDLRSRIRTWGVKCVIQEVCRRRNQGNWIFRYTVVLLYCSEFKTKNRRKWLNLSLRSLDLICWWILVNTEFFSILQIFFWQHWIIDHSFRFLLVFRIYFGRHWPLFSFNICSQQLGFTVVFNVPLQIPTTTANFSAIRAWELLTLQFIFLFGCVQLLHCIEESRKIYV